MEIQDPQDLIHQVSFNVDIWDQPAIEWLALKVIAGKSFVNISAYICNISMKTRSFFLILTTEWFASF